MACCGNEHNGETTRLAGVCQCAPIAGAEYDVCFSIASRCRSGGADCSFKSVGPRIVVWYMAHTINIDDLITHTPLY